MLIQIEKFRKLRNLEFLNQREIADKIGVSLFIFCD
jgi:DNA-binding XRE family transcriptional regulator